MRLRSPRRASTLAVATLCLAVVSTACQPGSSPGTTSLAGSGSVCAAVAPPASDPEGWGPPASAPEIVPVLISNLIDCGQNRVLFSVIDAAGRPIGSPDRTVSVAFYSLGRDPRTPVATADGQFVWAIEDAVGVYVANVSFPESGRYGAEFRTAVAGGEPEAIRLTFDVQPDTPVVEVGDRAPASKTPTLADVGGDPSKVSTDPEPLAALYETSIDAAVANHEPFVAVFATPKFCQTAQCGPTLDRIKPFVARYPGVRFINVEPYRLRLEGETLEADLDANGQLQPVGSTEEWRLRNEPVVFVVDRDGFVRAVFELIFSDEELTAALDALG